MPLSPSGRSYHIPLSPKSSDWNQLSQFEACLSRPTLDGKIHENKLIDLKVTAELRTGDQKGAQIVVVNGCMVAKIYDPLYYPATDDLLGKKNDVVRDADTDYCYEAAAYNELIPSSLQGKFIPEFYDSWVINILQDDTPRQVPMILMELIDGICMYDLDPKPLSEEERNTIITRVLEAEAQVFHHGVCHRDLHPRNIIISPHPSPSDLSVTPEARIVLVDFNIAQVERLAGGVPSKSVRSKIVSPAYRQWGHLSEFVVLGWIPQDEQTDYREWLWNTFEHDERFVLMRRYEGNPRRQPYLVEYG
jgi:serine/threonine protein kinase